MVSLQVISAGLEAAKNKGVKSIAIPMVGAGNQRRDPVEMVHAIVKACEKFSREQVFYFLKINEKNSLINRNIKKI